MRQLSRVVASSVGLGAGLGLAFAGALVAAAPRTQLNDDQVKERARILGMVDLTNRLLGSARSSRIAIAVGPHTEFAELGAILREAGVLKTGEALVLRAQERGRTNRLRPGVYLLAVDDRSPQLSVIDEIIDQVTIPGG